LDKPQYYPGSGSRYYDKEETRTNNVLRFSGSL